MKIQLIIIILICIYINSFEINQTFYNDLKENAEFEVINIDFNSSISRALSFSGDTIGDISDIITLIEVFYSLYSGTPDYTAIAKLAVKVIKDGLFSSNKPPDTYDFTKESKNIFNFLTQRQCESASSYAVAILMTYRRYKKEEEFQLHLPFTIQESLGICKKYNILDALNYAYENGLIQVPCDIFYYEPSYNYLECYDTTGLLDTPVYKVEKEYYKGFSKPYKIEGEENIKREIYKRGPVIATYKLYEGMAYYSSGYISQKHGNLIGNHEAIIYGWDNEGWLVQSVFGDFWGDSGRFKVKFDNDIEFGYIAFANSKILNISFIHIFYYYYVNKLKNIILFKLFILFNLWIFI